MAKPRNENRKTLEERKVLSTFKNLLFMQEQNKIVEAQIKEKRGTIKHPKFGLTPVQKNSTTDNKA